MTTTTTPSTVLVTVLSRGLGKSNALHLAQQGLDVVLTYKSQHTEAVAVVAQVEAVQAQWGRKNFHVLVNNAGAGAHRSLMQTMTEQFDTLVNAHFMACFSRPRRCCR